MQNKISKSCTIFRLYIIQQEGKEMDFAWACEQSAKLVEMAYVDVCICVCIYMYIYWSDSTYTYIYTHVHIHTHKFAQHFITDM